MIEKDNRWRVAVESLHPAADDYMKIEYHVGKACNFSCHFCHPSIHQKGGISPKTIEQLYSPLEKIYKQILNKKIRVAFTGGEPYLVKNFNELLSRCKKLGINRLSVTTNGSVKEETYIESLQYLNKIAITYHFEGSDREKLKHKIKNINVASKQKNCEVIVNVMLVTGFFNEIEETIKFFKENNIDFILRRVRPQVNAEGEILMPGDIGMNASALAVDNKLEYYSKEELEWIKEYAEKQHNNI